MYPGFPLHRVPVIEDAIYYLLHIITLTFQITKRLSTLIGIPILAIRASPLQAPGIAPCWPVAATWVSLQPLPIVH
jgi:hypothetical protein